MVVFNLQREDLDAVVSDAPLHGLTLRERERGCRTTVCCELHLTAGGGFDHDYDSLTQFRSNQCDLKRVFEWRLEDGLHAGQDDPRYGLDAKRVELDRQERERGRHGAPPLLNAVPKGHDKENR
jgi:hypothetical protein